MTKAEMRKAIANVHTAIIDSLPTEVSNEEMMYIYQKVAHLLLTETTKWAYEDCFEEES